jgi:mono/diheme cytochrome c family protein
MNARSFVWALAATAACNDGFVELDLERMIDQKKYRAYQSSEFFDDGSAMRTPPAETVARDRITRNPALAEGLVDGRYVDEIPVAITRDLVDQGHDRFDTFCAACHGLLGDGDSIVAANMPRRPPSLIHGDTPKSPPGRIFQIVTHGYGMMRSYAEDLGVEERWAVIAYLRALQLRSGVPLYALPLALRERAERELP